VSELLSQDEIDALVKGVSDGSVASEEDGGVAAGSDGPSAAQAIDITNQERSVRGRLPGLDVVLGRFVRDLRDALATFFGQVPAVTIEGVEIMKFASFSERLAQPVGLLVFRLSPLRGQGLLVIRPPFLSAVLQIVFGGMPGRKLTAVSREFSAIEQRVMERVGRRILEELRAAWKPVAPLECSLDRIETNPLFAAVAASHELVMHVDVRVELEGVEGCGFSVCIPNTSLDPVREVLSRALAGDDREGEAIKQEWAQRLRAAVGEAPIEVSARLGRATLSMREVLGLKAGDLVPLETGRDGPVVVEVAGEPRFLGSPGVSGSVNAVRITERL